MFFGVIKERSNKNYFDIYIFSIGNKLISNNYNLE